MKKKGIALFLASVLCFGLTACGNDNSTEFRAHWNAGDNNELNPATNETCKYVVTYEKPNETSTLDYTDGVYTTTLTAENGLYVYTTNMTIKATIIVDGEAKTYDDSVVSRVEFHETVQGLKPVSSQKKVTTTSPVSMNGVTERYMYEMNITYNENCTSGELQRIDYSIETDEKFETKKSFKISQNYSCIDNEEVLLAVRAIVTKNETFNVYNASLYAVQKVGVERGTETSDKYSFKLNGEDGERTVVTLPYTVKLKETNSGTAQTVYVAKNNSGSDDFRSVIIKMETPLPYGYGKLVYNLTEFTKA